ncbi:ribonuclease H-like domain-containing protein [Tanacetum coccineum]
MLNYKPCRTPVDTDSKLSADGAPISDSTLYRSLAGALQYLTFTRPDISYAVQQVCLFMHDPREPHLSALKRILGYVRGTLVLWITAIILYDVTLVGLPDAIGRVVSLLVDQPLVIVFFLATIFSPGHRSANLLSLDLVLRLSIGVLPMRLLKLADLVATGAIRILHVPSRYQYADIFTKGLPSSLFDEFRTSLSVRSSPAPTAGGERCKVAAGKRAELLKNLLIEISLWPKPIALISIRCDSAATLAKTYNQMYN